MEWRKNMKARVKDAAVRVSIGMIVKNEEKTLRQCLEALNSLRKQVSCELIIADTGSTDSTWEIAEEFADVLFHFEWCNDFAAARNSTIERAHGEWYMYLDGDEIFESTDQLVEFFNSEERRQYGCASYVVRNYSDKAHTDYGDFNALRIHRMVPGIHFESPIHEYISFLTPIKRLDDFAHHEGYIYDSAEEQEAKRMRNQSLLRKMLEDNPEDIRAIAHIIRDYNAGTEPEEYNKYLNMGLDLARKNLKKLSLKPGEDAPPHTYIYYFLHMKARSFVGTYQYEKVPEVCEEYFGYKRKEIATDLDMCLALAISDTNLKKYEEAIPYYKRYLLLYEKYRRHELDTVDMLFDIIYFTQKEHVSKALGGWFRCCIETENYEEAFLSIDVALQKHDRAHSQILECIVKSGQYEKLLHYYQQIQKMQPSEVDAYINEINKYYLNYPDYQEKIAQAMGKTVWIEPENGTFHIYRLRAAHNQMDIITAQTELKWFFRQKALAPEFEDVIFYALDYAEDISPLFTQVRSEDLGEYLDHVGRRFDKMFINVVMNHFGKIQYPNNIMGLYWTVMILENVLLYEDQDPAEKLEASKWYVKNVVELTKKLYQPEILQEQNIPVLTGAYRFAFYMDKADQARKSGDGAGYVRLMRQALEHYPAMAKPVALLLEDFQNSQRPQPAAIDEFSALAQKFKESIRMLMEKGDTQNASELLSKYETIRPDDPEIAVLRKLMPIHGVETQTPTVQDITEKNKRVLMIAYYYPPLSGSGVFRSLKFSKYLPEFGWIPTIVSAVNPAKAWNFADDSLCAEIPETVEVLRVEDEVGEQTRTKIGGDQLENLMSFLKGVLSESDQAVQIMDKMLGMEAGIRGLCVFPCQSLYWAYCTLQYLEQNMDFKKFQVVYTTSGPHSSHLVGYYLKKKLGIPWVADFRDEWIYNPYSDTAENLNNNMWVQLLFQMEQIIVDKADHVITVTEPAKKNYMTHYYVERNKITAITNGYDEPDFQNLGSYMEKKEKFVISYSGLLYTKERNITPVLYAIKSLMDEKKIPEDKVEFKIIGSSEYDVKERAEEYGLGNMMTSLPYSSHEEAIRLCLDSDMLLCLVGDGAKFNTVLPGKVFEYLRSGKPILALASPNGTLGNILKKTHQGEAILSTDTDRIKKFIYSEYQKWEKHPERQITIDKSIEKFERKYLTNQLAEVFDSLK